ncbi:unnamed protein product [Parascedosporium putredinis]|uniref:F-box domain-containing protein n=1 Tax=Parascedosporium putredinis TaxID=1442378 RepID=A0A9P1GXB3_9PEZI|nr:unnamed protein product [Parascedosporium putredinis]CAI7988860.1 unnamed protein product [Parascedosporium putredinis]
MAATKTTHSHTQTALVASTFSSPNDGVVEKRHQPKKSPTLHELFANPRHSYLVKLPTGIPTNDLSPAIKMVASASLEDLPTEVRLDICHYLDVESVFKLAQVNRSFNMMFKSNRAGILLPILQRDFSPLDELLQVFTASDEDLETRGLTYQPRRVIFQRSKTRARTILAPGGFRQPDKGETASGGFTRIGKKSAKPNVAQTLPMQTVVVDEEDLDSLLQYCLVVRQWEELFPHLRWIKDPASCRFLDDHERHAFRRALYRWWLYAFYFHGELPRPRDAQPTAFVDDIRMCQMRMCSTAELLELLDLLAAVFHLVQHYICPTLEQNLADEDDYSSSQATDAEVCWNDQSRLGRIIRTYTKLDPKELVHYFESIYSYPKKRLISDIRLNHPCFTNDQESMQAAIRSVLEERSWLEQLPIPTDAAGGIIRFDDERDEEMDRLGHDCSVDGSLPEPASYVRSFSTFNPRGDDGSGNDAWSYPSRSEPGNRLALAEAVH